MLPVVGQMLAFLGDLIAPVSDLVTLVGELVTFRGDEVPPIRQPHGFLGPVGLLPTLDLDGSLAGGNATGTACGDSAGGLLSAQQFRLSAPQRGFGAADRGPRRGCLGLFVGFTAQHACLVGLPPVRGVVLSIGQRFPLVGQHFPLVG
jgi:hypothetical protein